MANGCKEDIVAKFKDVSLHLYDVNGQDNIYMRTISVPSEEPLEVQLITTLLYCPCLLDTHRISIKKIGDIYGRRSDQYSARE